MPWGVVAGAAIGAIASNQAANKQSDAANRAAGLSEAQFQQMRSDLMPWQQSGTVALDKLNYLLGLGPTSQSLGERPTAPNRSDQQFMKPGPRNYGTQPGWPGYGQSGPATFDEQAFNDAMSQYQRELAMWNAGQQGISQQSSDPAFGSLLEPFSLDKFYESPAYQFNVSEGMKELNNQAAARGDYYATTTLDQLGKRRQDYAGNEFQNAFGNYNTSMENIWRRLNSMSETGRGAATQVGQAGTNAAGQQGEAYMQGANAQGAGIMGVGNAINKGIGDAYSNYLQSQVLQQSQTPTYGSAGYYDPNFQPGGGTGLRIR